MADPDINSMSAEDLQSYLTSLQQVKEGQRSSLSDALYTAPSTIAKFGLGLAATPASAMEQYQKLTAPAPPPGLAGSTVPTPSGGTADVTKAPAKANTGWTGPYENLKGSFEQGIGHPLYEPQTATGRTVDRVLPDMLAAVAGPEGMARNLMIGAGAGIGGSMASEAARSSGFDNQTGAAGMMGTAAGSMIPALLRKRITPNEALNPSYTALGNTLEGYLGKPGLLNKGPVPPSLKTGQPALLDKEQSMFNKKPEVDPAAITQFALTKSGVDPAVAKSGMPIGPMLDEQLGTMQNKGQLGAKMDQLATDPRMVPFKKTDPATGQPMRDPNGNFLPHPELEAARQDIIRKYQASGGKLSADPAKPTPLQEAMNITFQDPVGLKYDPSAPNRFAVQGAQYQPLRKALADRANAAFTNSDPVSGKAIAQLGSTLDKHVADNGIPEWGEVHDQYESALTARRALNMQGNRPGYIEASNLRAASDGHPNSDLYKMSHAATDITTGANAKPDKASGWKDALSLVAGGLGAYGAAKGYPGVEGVLPFLAAEPAARLLSRSRVFSKSAPGQMYEGNQALAPREPPSQAELASGVPPLRTGEKVGNQMQFQPRNLSTMARLLALEGTKASMPDQK